MIHSSGAVVALEALVQLALADVGPEPEAKWLLQLTAPRHPNPLIWGRLGTLRLHVWFWRVRQGSAVSGRPHLHAAVVVDDSTDHLAILAMGIHGLLTVGEQDLGKIRQNGENRKFVGFLRRKLGNKGTPCWSIKLWKSGKL